MGQNTNVTHDCVVGKTTEICFIQLGCKDTWFASQTG